MQTNHLKSYAPKARVRFMEAVKERLALLGLSSGKDTASVQEAADVVVINGKAWPGKVAAQRRALVAAIADRGLKQVVEEAAYSWFNRLAALRYMELHGYLGHGCRVLSHPGDPEGKDKLAPEILGQLEHLEASDLPGLNKAQAIDLKLANKDEELFRMLLLAQCNALHEAMPFLFEKVDDATEILLPDHLLRPGSVMREMVSAIPEADWQQIEIIGWLYQFYISEKKDQVIGKVVKSEDIPAATQLFTPNWIVKYMVQNALGAQWLATYPDSPLKAQMAYYIEPAEQTEEVNAQLAAITPGSLEPEKLTLIDPACGSGHILVEAYDLFKAIYLERGFRQREVPQLILENNLFGLDIDPRAAQLTGFALMMKGRADDRRLFEKGIQLHVMAMVNADALDPQAIADGLDLAAHGLEVVHLLLLKDLFKQATTFGSLIQIPDGLAEKLPALEKLAKLTGQDMYVSKAIEPLAPLVRQAAMLAKQYDAVVANPPYMGSKGQNKALKDFAKDHFKESKADLFAMFMDRGFGLIKAKTGHHAMVTMQSWMFLSSYEAMRKKMLEDQVLVSMAHLGPRAFGSISGEVVNVTSAVCRNVRVADHVGTYLRLIDGEESQKQDRLIVCSKAIKDQNVASIQNRTNGWFHTCRQSDFQIIPGSPIAYWASNAMRDAFKNGTPLSSMGNPCQGMATTNNDLFVRQWFEVSKQKIGYSFESEMEAEKSGLRWFPYNKGGSFRKWYGNNESVVDFENNGMRVCDYIDSNPNAAVGSNGRVINRDKYFSQSITWSFVSSSHFGVRYSKPGAIFDVGGSSLFPEGGKIAFVTALLCSKIAYLFLKTLNPTLNFQAGNLASIPLVDAVYARKSSVDELAKSAVDLAEADWDSYERSWDFAAHPLLLFARTSQCLLSDAYDRWEHWINGKVSEMRRIEEENNRHFIQAYGLQDDLTPDVPLEQITLTVNPAYRYGIKGTEEERQARFRQDTAKELMSYAVGCMMGRYSLDEPGLVYAHAGNEGFDPSRYASFPADEDGIVPITDIDWFDDDAANRLFAFIAVAWPKQGLEQNLGWLAESLGTKKNETARDTLRRYMANPRKDGFFDHHLSTYKKRPIYWLLSSGKEGAFQALIYLHRYHAGTLARVRSEYVLPLLGKMAHRIETLEAEEKNLNTQDRKHLATLKKQHAELIGFEQKLHHLADQRIALDLDDGVKVNYGKFEVEGESLFARKKDVCGK